MGDVKKTKTQNELLETKYNAWDKKYSIFGLMADDTLKKKWLMNLKLCQ